MRTELEKDDNYYHFRYPKIYSIERIDKSYQTEVLCTEISPAHWQSKYSKDKCGQIQLEQLQVCNQIAWKMIKNIDKIAEAAVLIADNSLVAK